ncbi:hypothetical protein D3C85_392610 [compost metagenome]
MKNPRNANHQQKRVLSKSKFQRILKKNLDSTGYAYIEIKNNIGEYEVRKTKDALKIGKFLYARFPCMSIDSFYYIRYSLEPNEACDQVSFQPNSDSVKKLMELINE